MAASRRKKVRNGVGLVIPLMQTPLLYLDAGSASMILSAIAGGVAGVVVAGRMFLARISGRVRRSSSTADQGELARPDGD